MRHIGTVPLYTPRLMLRRYTMEDVDTAYANWMSDTEVARYVTWERHPDKDVTRAVLQVWIDQYASDHAYHWGIETDGVLIGDIAVISGSQQHEHAEIGYCMGKAWWGQGLMTEAFGRVLRFMLEQVGLHRVIARHDILNIGSGRVMQKNGMVHEGTMRQHYRRKDGTFADLLLYGILRDEWIAAHPHEE